MKRVLCLLLITFTLTGANETALVPQFNSILATHDNFIKDVALGNITGASLLTKFGCNPDVDAGQYEDLWVAGGDHTWVSAAEAVDVASDDTADDGSPVGTGALTARIFGLDSAYDEIQEDITLDGTSNVRLVNSYIRIYRMHVLTAGTTGWNEGVITATGATSSAVFARINGDASDTNPELRDGQSMQALYTIPNNKFGLLYQYHAGIVGKAGASGQLKLLTRDLGASWRVRDVSNMESGHTIIPVVKVLAPKTDVRLRVNTDTANSQIAGGFNIILFDQPS